MSAEVESFGSWPAMPPSRIAASRTFFAIGPAFHDDRLFVELAEHLVNGRWLGPYNQFTLAKGPMLSFFIAAAFKLGVPLLLAQQLLYAAASATGSSLVMGAMHAEEDDTPGEERVYNSVLAMDPATPGVGWHNKHHLVPFSEFFPVPGFIRDWLRLKGLPYANFDRGAAQQAPLKAAGQFIAAGICYEDAYGSTLLPPMRTATMLLNVTNDSWFGRSPARYQHLQISRLRTMETGRPMVRAANDGVSALISHHGEILVSAPEYEPTVMRGTLQPRTGLTPYARTGNWPVVCLVLVFGLAAAWVGRRDRSARGNLP